MHHHRYDFLAREAEVAALSSLTLEDVRNWYATYLSPSSPTRRRLAVHITPARPCPASGAVTAATPAEGAGAGQGTESAATTSAPEQQAAGQQDQVKSKVDAQGQAAGSTAAAPVQVVEDLKAFKSGCERWPLLQGKLPPVVGALGAGASGTGGAGSKQGRSRLRPGPAAGQGAGRGSPTGEGGGRPKKQARKGRS
jgi:hypothetical protein